MRVSPWWARAIYILIAALLLAALGQLVSSHYWPGPADNPSRQETAGEPVSCVNGFRVPRAQPLISGLIDPRGVAAGLGRVWVADGPRLEPIHVSAYDIHQGSPYRMEPCPAGRCGAVDMRGVISIGANPLWLRHDLHRLEAAPGAYPLLSGPAGLAAVSPDSFLITNDYPHAEGSLVYLRNGQPDQLLDDDLTNPTGVAISEDRSQIYVTESAPWETRWRVYDFDAKTQRATRKSILGSAPRSSASQPAFEGIAVYRGFVFSAAQDGLYIFKGQELQGKLAMTEAVTGVAVDEYGKVYFAAGHNLYLLSLFGQKELALYFMGNRVGAEAWQLESTKNSAILRANFSYTERGSYVPLTAELRMNSDFTPQEFSAKGKSYRPFSVDAKVNVKNPPAQPFFTLQGYAPFSVQMMLLRYWLAHDRPAKVAQLPAGPGVADISIHEAGVDTIHENGRKIPLTRYTLNNIVWGRETVWLDSNHEIAAASSYAGGLPLDAIRPGYTSAFDTLKKSATADRLGEARSLGAATKPLENGAYAITGARLIDGTERPPLDDAVVIVRDGFIASAGARLPIPAGMRVVDAKGMTILPGLWDMHAHFAQVEYGPAYLAAGVTSVRDCGDDFAFVTAVSDAAAKAQMLSPRLYLAGLVDGSGPITFGTTWADTPAEGVAAVAKYKAAGYRQMKIYDGIRPDVLRAIAAEAHRVGMTVTGHVPRGMTAQEGVLAGMDQINHLGAVFRANDVEFFRQHGTVVDPTMAWNELLGRPANIPIETFEPGYSKAPWVLTSLFNTSGGKPAEKLRTPLFTEMLTAVRDLYRAGVPIVAGTDKAIPGHSLHRELELYVEAGLTPMEVIRIATAGAAKAMGVAGQVGTVEPGKHADLILVEGDPLKDFAALRKVRRVMTGGRLYDTATLWNYAGFTN